MKIKDSYSYDNLLMRKPSLQDAEIIYDSYTQDPEVTKYLSWNKHSNLNETENFIKYVLDRWNDQSEFHFVICLKEINEPIGMISLKQRNHMVTLGYVLSKEYWRKGIMSNIVNYISDLLLKLEDITRVEAICDKDNIGSRKVLEKSGFYCEGILRKYIVHPAVSALPRDVYIFSKIK